MPDHENTGGWSRSEERVNYQLEKMEKSIDALRAELGQIGKDVVAIKTEQRVRGGMFGAAGGLLATGIIKFLEVFGGAK